MIYEVGKPFPNANPMPGQEFALSDINTAFFDILCYMSNPDKEEVQTWKKGKLRYGVYVLDAIPFFIIDFPAAGWNLDININILKVKRVDDMDAWLNAEGNTINLFLIDSRTNILNAMRAISIRKNISELIRDVLDKQIEKYDKKEDADMRIAQIQHTMTTAQMIGRAEMITL